MRSTDEQRKRHPIATRIHDVIEPVTAQYLVKGGYAPTVDDARRMLDQLQDTIAHRGSLATALRSLRAWRRAVHRT